LNGSVPRAFSPLDVAALRHRSSLPENHEKIPIRASYSCIGSLSYDTAGFTAQIRCTMAGLGSDTSNSS
jgi:hypothetical protein